MSVLIAGVGYHHLRDLSFGPDIVNTLRALEWPAEVEIDDWSWGPIAIVQQIEAQPYAYERMVFIAAVERGRSRGRVYAYRWDKPLPSADEIQQRIGEAIMGVISLDSLLIIMQQFNVLPAEVFVIEVEPEDCEFGFGFSPGVEALRGAVLEHVRDLALERVAGRQ